MLTSGGGSGYRLVVQEYRSVCSVILENQSCGMNFLDAVNSWYRERMPDDCYSHIASESERTVTELHQMANMQLQVEEAEEARRREGKTLEEIRQLRHENQELQRRIYETEELIHLQKNKLPPCMTVCKIEAAEK